MPQESNAAAQNKMGELFVDFGTKGLGGLLKGLNGVKAQFLLTKAAAEQAIKPLVGMSKDAAGTVTELNKISAVTGLTVKQLQDLKVWSQLNNVSFGELTNQLQTMQRNLLDIKLGRGDVSGYQLLGLDPSQLDYRKPMEAFAKIREQVQQVDEATGALALRQLGFSEDLLYAFKQQNNAIDRRLFLNDKDIESLNRQQQAWNQLSATWSLTQQKFIANQPIIIKLIDKTTEALQKLNAFSGGTPEQKTYMINQGIDTTLKNAGLFFKRTLLPDFTQKDTTFIQKLGIGAGDILGNYLKYTFSGKKAPSMQTPTKKIQPFDAPSNLPPLPNLPVEYTPNSYNYKGDTNINVNNYISGANAQDIATQTSNVMIEDLNNLEVLNNR